MANLFRSNQAGTTAVSPRQALEMKYNTARANLFLALGFTLVNLVLLFAADGTYFLFSAFIPYYFVLIGALLCGKLPADYYEEGFEPLPTSVMAVCIVLAAIFFALLLLCALMSKKLKSGWLVAALVLFAIDTAAAVLLQGVADGIIDILFHAWVIYYLVVGIRVPAKIRALPEDVPEEVVAEGEAVAEEAAAVESEAAEETPAEQESATEEPDAWAQLRAMSDDNKKDE